MSKIAKYFQPELDSGKKYIDKHFEGTEEQYFEALSKSATIYVSALNQAITEERIWMLFSLAGQIKRVIMGINKKDFRPCGFCFIDYYKREDAERAINFFNHFRFDGRLLKCNFDHGFAPGREFGRGQRGGQVSDDYLLKRVRHSKGNRRY